MVVCLNIYVLIGDFGSAVTLAHFGGLVYSRSLSLSNFGNDILKGFQK